MSGNNEITNSAGPASSTEPSMEEILASIRRILRDEQSSGQEATPAEADEDEELLVLDSSMMVKPEAEAIPVFQHEPQPVAPEATIIPGPDVFPPEETAPAHLTSEPSEPDYPVAENETFDLPALDAVDGLDESPAADGPSKETYMSDNRDETVQAPRGLVGEAASEAAASSIGSLIRSIGSERSIAIGRPGLTLEDLVREELRPLLKSWLDSNLPGLVERIVRAEIQRVVERSGV